MVTWGPGNVEVRVLSAICQIEVELAVMARAVFHRSRSREEGTQEFSGGRDDWMLGVSVAYTMLRPCRGPAAAFR